MVVENVKLTKQLKVNLVVNKETLNRIEFFEILIILVLDHVVVIEYMCMGMDKTSFVFCE